MRNLGHSAAMVAGVMSSSFTVRSAASTTAPARSGMATGAPVLFAAAKGLRASSSVALAGKRVATPLTVAAAAPSRSAVSPVARSSGGGRGGRGGRNEPDDGFEERLVQVGPSSLRPIRSPLRCAFPRTAHSTQAAIADAPLTQPSQARGSWVRACDAVLESGRLTRVHFPDDPRTTGNWLGFGRMARATTRAASRSWSDHQPAQHSPPAWVALRAPRLHRMGFARRRAQCGHLSYEPSTVLQTSG
jgi:hypothetical protein